MEEDIGESTTPIPSDSAFEVRAVVLAFHGHLLYEARVLSVHYEDEDNRKVKSYTVHYQGWKKSWEETVSKSMVFEHNDDNLRVAHRLLNGAKLRQQALQPVSSCNEIKKEKQVDDSIPNTPISTSTSTDHLFILPPPLQKLLIEDWEFITKESKLVSLPRDPNVSDVLNKWVNNKKQGIDKASKEVAEALIEYFDAALPKTLLYRFERKQYNDTFSNSNINNKKSNNNSPNGNNMNSDSKSPSNVYGAEHLLRLLHKLPFMLECSSVARDTMQTVAEKVNDLTKYMQKNGRTFFLTEYPNAPKSYVKYAIPK